MGHSNSMPMSFNAIIKLLRTRRIPFLGLTGTGLDDFDGHMIAHALTRIPPRNTEQISLRPDTLELTQIAFNPEVRARLMKGGEKADVRVYLSSPEGPALRGRR